MRMIDICAGIGGFSLAGHWAGWETVEFVEKDKFCQKVLAKNFPNTKIHGDLYEYTGRRGSAEIIAAGFPCQPFSKAGKRNGEKDDRYLWPEVFRVVREIQPAWVVLENVAGLISMENGGTLERVCTDLESEGYAVQPFIVPACAVEAWHRRDRIWIIAYSDSHNDWPISKKKGKKGKIQKLNREKRLPRKSSGKVDAFFADPNRKRKQRSVPKKIQRLEKLQRRKGGGVVASIGEKPSINIPVFSGRNDGIPGRVDRHRRKRIKALGNAIVSQVAYEIFKHINEYNTKP
jgi:DNA (cytosine-5)-methyltransferase 1